VVQTERQQHLTQRRLKLSGSQPSAAPGVHGCGPTLSSGRQSPLTALQTVVAPALSGQPRDHGSDVHGIWRIPPIELRAGQCPCDGCRRNFWHIRICPQFAMSFIAVLVRLIHGIQSSQNPITAIDPCVPTRATLTDEDDEPRKSACQSAFG